MHTAVSKGFHDRGYHLGHVTGHSIGMTMIEFPKVGEGSDVELRENMVLSMHPHAIAANGEDCLYMQDTWLVTPPAACRSPTSRWRSGWAVLREPRSHSVSGQHRVVRTRRRATARVHWP